MTKDLESALLRVRRRAVQSALTHELTREELTAVLARISLHGSLVDNFAETRRLIRLGGEPTLVGRVAGPATILPAPARGPLRLSKPALNRRWRLIALAGALGLSALAWPILTWLLS